MAGEAKEGSPGKAESAPEVSSSSASRKAAKSSLPLDDDGDGDGTSARLIGTAPREEGQGARWVGGDWRTRVAFGFRTRWDGMVLS